jgi:transcriptional regulator with XRE-family HTH domain
MRTFLDYVEQAKTRAGIPSDNQLARRIGITSASLCQLKQNRSAPSGKTTRALAELAGIPEDEAALDLAMWRAEREGATWLTEAYTRLFRHAAAPAILAALVAISPTGTKAAQINQAVTETIHYATKTGDPPRTVPTLHDPHSRVYSREYRHPIV